MPPDSLGTPLHAGVTHREHLQCTTSLRHVIRPVLDHKAASTNTEFDTSATCHIDHASLTESLPCNSGGPVIQDPDLHAHVVHKQHEDHPQATRPVRTQLVAACSRLDSHYNYSVGTKSAATTTSSMDAIIASQHHHESKFCATSTTSSLTSNEPSASSSTTSRIQRFEDDIRRLMDLTYEQHSDIPEGSETRASNAAGPAAFLASSARSTSSCSSTSTSSKIDTPTRKPLPDCEIEQISPPNGWFASSRNPKGEVGATPKEPSIPSYATSHPQFDYARSRGWSIDIFIYCHDWYEPQEPITGPLNVPQCMREPGLAPRLDDLSALNTGGHHLTKVLELLTNGEEVFYDRTTNLFLEADWDYDSDEDEDPGLHQELINADQLGNYSRVMSSSGLTNQGEHPDPSAEVPRQTESTATLKTSSTPPDLPGGGGIEPTSPPKSITSLGSTPSGHALANPSPHASDPGELRLEMVQVHTSRGIAWALHAPQGLEALALRLKCSVDTLRKARFDSEDYMSEKAHGERTSDPGMPRSTTVAQDASTHHGEDLVSSASLHTEVSNSQGHRRQSTAPPSPAVELPNADPAAPPRAPLTINVPTPQDGSGPPATSGEDSPPVAGGLAPQDQAGPLQMLYWLRFASVISIMTMISSALNAAIPNVLAFKGEIAKASSAAQAGGGEALSSSLSTTSEAPCQVRQPSATGSSDSIAGLAKLKEGSYPPRIASSRGEIIHKTFISAPSGTLKVGSRLPTVLDVTKATARLESAEDVGSILKMAATPNAGTHTLDTMAEAKREIGPQGLTVALSDPVATGPSPVSQPEAAIVTKLRVQSANSDAEGQVYDLSALRSSGLNLKQIYVDQDPRSRPPQAVGKSSTSSVILIEGLFTPKSSYLADQGVALDIEETSSTTPYKITPLPTLKTEIVANPPTPTAEGQRPSPQDPGLLPECPGPKPRPPATAQGFTSSDSPENPGLKISHRPRGDANSSSVQPASIQGRSISPEGQSDPDLCLQGVTGLLESIAKSIAVARSTSRIDPTLTLLTTGSVHPHTKTTSEPGNRVGKDLPDLPRPSDHHKLQEGRPPDRSPPSHGDRPNSFSSTTPAGTTRLDLNLTNKVEPGYLSTRTQLRDSLKVTKGTQHHGILLFQDLRYRNACRRASSSCSSTDQAGDATPTPPSRQPWHPTRQGYTLCPV